MAKFKRELVRLRQQLDELTQERGIGLEVRRSLHQNRSQLARLPHGLHALQKKTQWISSVLQPFEMGNGLVHFRGKTEIRSRALDPAFDCACGRHPAESGVQFDRVELRGNGIMGPIGSGLAVAAGGNFQLTFPYGDALAIFKLSSAGSKATTGD